MLKRPRLLVIAGPTASGKSALAIALAHALDGEIISADSMQIYRDLDIGTAKVSADEQEGIRHHMIDLISPIQDFSVAEWLEGARAAIQNIRSREKVPIVCGGTGLYIDSLIEGIVFAPQSASRAEILKQRAELRAELRAEGLECAHARLKELDPLAAERISPQDEKRIVRFFERLNYEGRGLSDANAQSRNPELEEDAQAYVLELDRHELYERINLRAREIFQAGLVDELQNLLSTYPKFEQSQAYQAIAYKEAAALLAGVEEESVAIERLAQTTRRYAKRQISWFKRKPYYRQIPLEGAYLEILNNYQA